MNDLAEIRRYCLTKPGAQEEFPFDPVTPVMKVGGKMFALVSLDESPTRINLTRRVSLRRVILTTTKSSDNSSRQSSPVIT